MINIRAPIWIDIFGHSGASGGRFRLAFEPIWGAISGSRARDAKLANNSTAPQREHDFRGPAGSKKGPKMAPKPTSGGNLAPRASWEPLGLDVGAVWGPF